MKLLVTLAAVMLVASAVAGERCGCNKPNINKPKQTVAVPAKPAPAKQQPTPRQCGTPAKPCGQRPVAK